VGLTEKGVAYIELSVEMEGGHAMTAPRHTAVGILSTAIHKLEQNQFPARLETPIRQMFGRLAAEMPLAKRMIFANLNVFGGLVKRQMGESPAANATIRTTASTTMFEAGDRPSILPTKAKSVVRLGILPGDSISSSIEFVRQAINDPRVKIKLLEESFTSEPSPVSGTNSPGFQIIEKTIRQVFPEVLIAPGISIAATDARHYAPLSNSIYRFCPLWLTPEDLNRIHGTDERISIESYERIVKFYVQLIYNSAL
jgi:carboxypeptidase PM20D1